MLQRQNPLPIGRYWQDIFASKWPSFHQWLKDNASKIHVEVTESTAKTAGDVLDSDGNEAREFVIFTVKSPVTWDQKSWGFPTVATPDVKSSRDTVQRPDPEKDPLDKLADAVGDVPFSLFGTIAKTIVVGTGVVVAVLAILKFRSKGK